MTKITHKASEEFVRKVKELLEVITGKPYLIIEKQFLKKAIWSIKLDKEKIKIGENKGVCWIQEEKNSIINIYSDKFYDINVVASEEYRLNQLIGDDLLEKENWEKYRKKVPGLIAELEAAERIAYEVNAKYGTNIRLFAGHNPYLKTSFDAKGMYGAEKLHEIEKHTKAMYETWKLWREWSNTVGREIYMKTSRIRLSKNELIDEVVSQLHDITKAKYTNGYAILSFGKKKPGIRWVIGGSPNFEGNRAANRGAWSVEDNEDKIVLKSDNLETINAHSIEEYNLIKQGRFGMTIVSPEIIERIADQVGQEFKVVIRVMKDKPVLVAELKTKGLTSYSKLYEIERHAKALAEVWKRLKEL
ncbi:MAG: hypothetical protein H3Z52_15015 [archaeon]|nr:hypothetical protein [archaeon]